ncbi:MAG TPA: enoyl-CoA hydratase/isomerase family protein [Acidimicrobiia bacterium]|jgi:enoyl-CoA hydratase/carnithine racemase
MSGDLVRFDATGRSATIVLNRADQANRVNLAMMRNLIDALERATATDSDVLVVTAAGPDFSLGRDQDEKPVGMSKRDNLSLILEANRLLTGFRGVTVAAVRGRALGFGSGVAVQCDLTIAADTAQFGFTEILHGFAPSIVMSYLETYVKRKAAVDLVMTGRSVSAVEARDLGLVTRVVAEHVLDVVVAATVDSLLAKPTAALRHGKAFLREIGSVPDHERAKRALDALAPLS